LIYLLDACALIALFKMEKGFEYVKDLLDRATMEEVTIFMSIVNLVEVYYGFIQEKGAEEADKIMNTITSFPITVISTITDAVYRDTARFKGTYSISLADAFLCATAKSLAATIVTKDREIAAVEIPESLSVLWIPSGKQGA
jgi:predicted nucleic acid-binding protein